MVRSALGKVAWVGRTASMVFGLALVLALVLGVASMALGADGDFFKVGRTNLASAVSTLDKSGAGPALRLLVDSGAPLAVNSSTKVANLNADRLDNREASSFANVVHAHAGEQITSGTVEADRVEDGSGSNLNADQLDGKDLSNIDPLTASVGGFSGNIHGAAEGVVSSSKIRTGVFVVEFNRSVSGCARVASLGRETSSFEDPDQEADPEIINVPKGQASPFNVTNVANPDKKIGVLTTDSAGTRADLSFQLAVFC